MPADPPPTDPNLPGGADVMGRIAHHALLSGLCQFIPVPFADDYADRRVRRAMVAKLLAARGRAYDADAVKPLWAGPPGSVLGKIGGVAKGLVLKPVKKLLRTVFFVFTIRRAILEAAEVLLLGHTLDRLLAAGRLGDGLPADARRDEAADVERAVAGVMDSPDRRALVTLVRASARKLRGIGRDAEDADPGPDARPDATADDAAEAEASLSPRQREKLDAASSELAGELQDEQGRSLLARLDAAVDARLAGGPAGT